jgi:type IV pilus assembly protein PilC
MTSRRRLAQAYFDLATLLDAGVPILRSLNVLIDGRRGRLKRTFRQVRKSLSQGANLAESLNQHRNVFPDFDRMLIEAAETAGSLGDSFKMLSQWHDFVHRSTQRIQLGLVYPFFMLHAAAFLPGLPALLFGRVSMAAYLGGAVRILAFLYIPMLLWAAFTPLRDRIPLVRWPLDLLVLRIPVLGKAIYHMSVCRYARAFAMLNKSGVPITETLERATRATGNVIVARQFAGARESVRRGGMAWEGFSRRLPSEYREVWQIGEETGALDKVADKVAEVAADRADLLFTAFTSGFPKVVYFAIVIFTAITILSLASQIYGKYVNLANF